MKIEDEETQRRGEAKLVSRPTLQFAASPRPTNPASSFRIFCALELPLSVRIAAEEHIGRLRAAFPDARASWERGEKLHVTMKFLGEMSEHQVATVSEAASRLTTDVRPFTLKLEGAGAFPRRGTPRLLWIGINETSGELARLQIKLEDACESVGFRRDERPFHAHVTIARIRAPEGARELARNHEHIGFDPLEFAVSELLVMRSELAPGGSRYSEISRHKFISAAYGR